MAGTPETAVRFIEQLGLFLLTLLLAAAAVGCLVVAGQGGDKGTYAIAAGLFSLAFVHLLVHSDREPR